ncbi:MtN3-like protein [Phytophthora infestans T30-4]|uniref:MtN3-like protein n=1 Tax=Phytophthora infestans (strain T30-4) TaxID=403677 RepID=D0NL14_PHYIT|nr:MtN3-like protein [Phytophthora infestans T30-4]EEY60332.1 MtN3-like protein [Phytophthora infestans T30-4]|eukprot:XP_002900128.1 MtN3-like protein [Phytophthora infestans T30-4]
MIVFLRYTADRWKAGKVIAVYAGALVFTSLSRNQVSDIMGYLAMCVTLTGIFIPIHMVIAGTINNAMWTTCTPMSGLWFLFMTNVCCAALGVVQLVIYWMYHPKKHPLCFGATLADLLEKERSDDSSVAVDRLSSVHSNSKVVSESPMYHNLSSPLGS